MDVVLYYNLIIGSIMFTSNNKLDFAKTIFQSIIREMLA